MVKNEYIKNLCDCPNYSEDCPYYDWKYQKCDMLATTKCHPKDECDEYFWDMVEEEEE
jgi:hypothetical protein